jgi:lambda family phage portal protein
MAGKKAGKKPVAGRFQAAKVSRLDGGRPYLWDFDYNQLVAVSNRTLRAKVRALVRNFPPFVRAIKSHCAFVIGKGGRFESRAVKKNGNPDDRLRKEIETRFNRWMETASVDGRLHFYECQRLAMKQRLETGEFFCLTQFRDGELGLRFVEPEDVTEGPLAARIDGNRGVYQGIEYDRETGERLAYFIRPYDPQDRKAESIKVPARDVLHGFFQDRPNQMRGVTPFSAAIILSDCMSEYIEAELDAAKMGAKWLAFVTSPEPKQMQIGRVTPPKDGEPEKIEELENCVIEYLRTGESVQLAAAPNRVTDSFDRFTSFVLRMVGLTIGVPYEILSGDYQGINYSTSRMSRQDYNVMLEPERFWVDQSFNRPVFRKWMGLEALKSPETFKDYFANPWRYEQVEWIPAGMPSPDPLKEGKADIDAINAGLLAPQDVILARGDDPERVIEKRREWRDMESKYGVTSSPGEVSTADQTNPAALGEAADGEGDGDKDGI